MDSYDPLVPQGLKKTQQWFASIITRPIQDNSKMLPTSPSGRPMKYEAKEYIAPSPTLKPHERIEIYNQQFWWRMISNMHETFPLVTRLFGFTNFNQQIAIPYLVKYPINHWSLNYLGCDLTRWVEEDYKEDDKELILDSVKIDWAFNAAFTTKQMPPIEIHPGEDISNLLSKTLYLQHHIYLFDLKYDLFSFREIFNKEDGDFWVEHEFPELSRKKKNNYFIIYRNLKNLCAWKEISAGEHFLLKQFQNGTTVEKACESLETAQKEVADDAMQNLQNWFQEWVIRGWLT